jgi:hypothetical protein
MLDLRVDSGLLNPKKSVMRILRFDSKLDVRVSDSVSWDESGNARLIGVRG